MKKLIFLWGLLMSHLFASEESIRVLIVGAGPAGLSVAKALQNKGIYPDIIEKEAQIRADGAAIVIPANASWALNKLGIDIGSKALLIRSMQFTDDQGDLLTQEEVDTIHPEGSQFYSLGRNELMEQLLSHIDKGTPIQTSTTIKHFSEDNDQVRVEFSNGETKFYDWVIGCDGVHSALRKKIHPYELPEFLGLLVWRTVIGGFNGITMPTYMVGSDRTVLLYPMPNNKTYVYGQLFQLEKNPPTEPFVNVFSSFGGLLPAVLHRIEEQNLAAKFYIHHMEKSHSVRFKLDGFSRVLLVGDAAHAFGPALQNGAAQAFEDAYVLQDLLSGKINAKEVSALLDAFEKRRLSRMQNIFTMSNVKIRAFSNPEQIQGRNDAIRKLGAPNVNAFKHFMRENP